jgi:vacuolar protein sorting-associated protein 13A/C
MLVGRREGYVGKIVRLKIGIYDEMVMINKEKVNIYVFVEVNPVFVIYQHQPIMRLIDYIIVQIVSLLREPEFLTMNTEFLE